MKLFLKISLLLFGAITVNEYAVAQNTFPVISTSVETACISNCMDQDSVPYVSDSSLIQVTMFIQLFEVTGIESIRVKLGTSSGASDLLNKTFDFDVSGNVGGGCSYSRTDYVITLGLGDYSGLISYFSEVILERTDHSLTDAVVFNR